MSLDSASYPADARNWDGGAKRSSAYSPLLLKPRPVLHLSALDTVPKGVVSVKIVIRIQTRGGSQTSMEEQGEWPFAWIDQALKLYSKRKRPQQLTSRTRIRKRDHLKADVVDDRRVKHSKQKFRESSDGRYGGADVGMLKDADLGLFFSLGMPKKHRRMRLVMVGGEFATRFKDYTIELFGLVANDADSYPYPSKSYPFYGLGKYYVLGHNGYNGPPAGDKLVLHVWSERFFWHQYPAFVQEIWDPQQDAWLIKLWNLESVPEKQRIGCGEHLIRGLQLDVDIDSRGRPPGGQLENAESQDLVDLYAYLWIDRQTRGEGPPTQYEMTGYLGVDRSTLYRRLRQKAMSWSELKSEGHARAEGLDPAARERLLKERGTAKKKLLEKHDES